MVSVATRLFSDDQLDQLRSSPDIGKEDLIRYFTLTGTGCPVRSSASA
jgi:hypothetical protein